jgi:hypothetical protein
VPSGLINTGFNRVALNAARQPFQRFLSGVKSKSCPFGRDSAINDSLHPAPHSALRTPHSDGVPDPTTSCIMLS